MASKALVVPKPKPVTTSRGTSFAEGAGEFLFGTTSFKKAAVDAAKGDWAGAAANAGWGAVSLGSTIISVVPGIGTAAGAGIKGAAAAAKAGKAVKTLEAGKTTVIGVKGGQALEKTVAGGKALDKPVMYSPGYPFKPPTKPLTPTSPNRLPNASPKNVPDDIPNFPGLKPQAKRSPWMAAVRNVGLSAGDGAGTSASYDYITDPNTSLQPKPQTSTPNNTETKTDTDTTRRRDKDSGSGFSSGTQFAQIAKVF